MTGLSDVILVAVHYPSDRTQLIDSLRTAGLNSRAEAIAAVARNAIVITESRQQAINQAASKFGGAPSYSGSWPFNADGNPLDFLCQLQLSDLAPWDSDGLLPKDGALLFFYDVSEQPWGFDPKHRSGWEVIYQEGPLSAQKAEHPKRKEKPRTGFLGTISSLFAEPAADHPLPEAQLTFHSILSCPAFDCQQLQSLKLSDAEDNIYTEWRSALEHKGTEIAQLLGYPQPIQNGTMEEECNLASQGVYLGDATHAQPASPQTATSDWILLLQMESHTDLHTMWGDGGRLYFWIRKQDLTQLNFSKVWLILQCF